MTHNFCRTFAKAVSRSRLCPHRTRDFVPATSNSALERRHSPRMPSQTLFDSGAVANCRSQWFGTALVAHCPAKTATGNLWHCSPPEISLHKNSEMRCRNKPLFSDGLNTKPINIRFWPLADIYYRTAHVRFREQSRHGFLREVAFGVAIRGRADMAYCGANVRL
jgi:hypothetical protein